MDQYPEQRKKLIKQWKQKKRGILKEELKQFFFEIYSSRMDEVQDAISPQSREDIELARKHIREMAAYECRETVSESKPKGIEELIAEVPEKIGKITSRLQEEINFMNRKIGQFEELEKEISRQNKEIKPELKEKVGSAVAVLREKCIAANAELIKFYNEELQKEMVSLYNEANAAIDAKLKPELSKFVCDYCNKTHKAWEESRGRKLGIPFEQRELLKFAFLFSQWEKEGYEHYEGLDSLFKQAISMPNFEKVMEKLVSKNYLAKEDADSALSYLNLAKSHNSNKLVPRNMLIEKDAPAPEVDPEEEEIERLIFLDQYKEKYKERLPLLTAVLPAKVAEKLFENNPSLAVMERVEFEKYLSSLHHYASTNKDAAAEVEKNISGFSKPENIEYLIKASSKKNGSQLQVTQEQMYDLAFRNVGMDFEIVDAIITNGMKIQKKIIGGAYIPSHVVLNKNLDSLYKKIGDTKETRREVEKTFEWLISQGAIIHHNRKGKSAKDSTVSLNPHISEIQFEPLSQYINGKLNG